MLWMLNIIARISLKRWKRFLAIFTLIVVISMLIPIITAMRFYETGIARVVPILGEAWYLRMSVGEPTEFTRIIERVLPFYRYPIFAVEFQDPFAPKMYYTYENLITTAILALTSSLFVCLYSEYASIKGSGLVATKNMKRKGVGLAQTGTIFPILIQSLIQSGSVAYAGTIVCSTCYGSLLIQITLAGLTITITSALAAYISSITFIVAVAVMFIFITHISRKIKKMGFYNFRFKPR